jgi:tRNA threonylcarbamoyladenosine modification (KEOPS) complex  Pcc1 subunit
MSAKNYTPLDNPVSLPKEAEPVLQKEIEYQEAVEHEPSPEVTPYVQKRAETIKLPPDLKKMGVQASSTSQTTSYQNVKIPISDDKVIIGMKAPINSSLRWLATLALYLLHQAHLSLKVVHGHAVRIFKK